MGIFDSLFGKKKDASGSPPAPVAKDGSSPVSQPASSAAQPAKKNRWKRAVEWDWDNPAARKLVHEILAEAAPRFGAAKIKEIPDDEHVDLRGTYDGAPVRFAVWMSFGTFWTIEMMCPNRLGEIVVERDHEKIPKHKDSDDPWDEQEERRVFLAKGIFFEGDDDEITEKLVTWAKLPESLQARILADMERLDLRAVRSYSKDVSLGQRPSLSELDDPIGYMEDCARLLASIKNAIAQGEGEPTSAPRVQIRGPVEIDGVRIGGAAQGGAAAYERFTCKYCSSVFLFTATSQQCPNCGAPPRN